MRLDETWQQPAAHFCGNLVDRIGRQDAMPPPSANGCAIDVRLPRVSRDSERAVRPVRFRNRPRMPIEAVDRAPAAFKCPGGACGPGAAAEIENLRNVAGGLDGPTISRVTRKCRGP